MSIFCGSSLARCLTYLTAQIVQCKESSFLFRFFLFQRQDTGLWSFKELHSSLKCIGVRITWRWRLEVGQLGDYCSNLHVKWWGPEVTFTVKIKRNVLTDLREIKMEFIGDLLDVDLKEEKSKSIPIFLIWATRWAVLYLGIQGRTDSWVRSGDDDKFKTWI